LPEDGYANNVNYIRLSANFPYYHRNIFGLSKNYSVNYLDSTGTEKNIKVPLFVPAKDSVKKDSIIRKQKRTEPKEKKILRYRSFTIDSSKRFATITLNTFSEGKLRSFFRRTFKHLRKENINQVVLDLRSNGGGRVGMSTLLTKYISRQKFRVADTLFTPSRGIGPYGKYIKGGFLNSIEMFLISRKNKDGNYHMRYLENHFYKPKNNNYKGKVYVLTGGPTFSASAIVCNILKGQKDITLLGEETGGGWYGNNGIMIPDIKLPNTGVRVRLPLFRLVQYNHTPIKGTGVLPDVLVPTSYDALLKGYDKKMEEVKKLIRAQ
jgi:C-terminal processing protease CtpA/Prc